MLTVCADPGRIKHWYILFCIALAYPPLEAQAQDAESGRSLPIIVSVFSESVSLPDFRGFFRNPNWGLRVGTEFYYRQSERKQLMQTLNLGYYRHTGLQQGLYLSSEFGYRKPFGRISADFTIGAGYLHLISELPRYEPAPGGYRKAGRHMHKLMPTAGLGLGYQLGEVTVFSRYEVFGEWPFSYGGAPLLPHKALHLGARIRSLY